MVKIKKYVFITICLLFVSLAYAEDKITLESYRAYHGEETDRLTWGDEEQIIVVPGDTLQIQMKFESTYNESVDMRVIGTLGLLEDLESKKDITIDADSTKSTVLEFEIPAEQKAGYYDLELEYRYDDINSSDVYRHKTTQEVQVKVTKAVINSDSVLLNLTQELADSKKQQLDLLSQAAECSDIKTQLSTCKESEGKLSAVQSSHDELQSKYDTKCTEADTCKTDLSSCNTKLDNYISKDDCQLKITDETSKTEKKATDTRNGTIIFLVVAAGGVYLFMKKKKDPSKEDPGTPIDWND